MTRPDRRGDKGTASNRPQPDVHTGIFAGFAWLKQTQASRSSRSDRLHVAIAYPQTPDSVLVQNIMKD